MVTCFNRDKDGNCLAFKPGSSECSYECSARIPTIEDKITLLNSLLARTRARKDIKELNKELLEAKQVQSAIDGGKYEGWMSCYMDDRKRGGKGGASEGDTSNRATAMKSLMKDNRPVGVKPTKAQNEEYKEALTEFEEKVGEKMEKLSRTSMTHSKVNSYTGELICFSDNGAGGCNGQRSASNRLAKECKRCEFLSERTKKDETKK